MSATNGDDLLPELLQVWQSVLNVQAHPDDSFAALGGSSIQTISLLLLIEQTWGVDISVDEFAACRNARELAAKIAVRLTGDQPANVQTQELIHAEPLPLLPVHYWLFKRANYQHFNVAHLLDLVNAPPADTLQEAFCSLLRHHAELRVRLRQDSSGLWHQIIPALADLPTWWHSISLAKIATEALPAAITEHCERFQAASNIEHQPLAIVHFDLGAGRGRRLLIVLHHILIDNIGERIFFSDLRQAVDDLCAGRVPVLHPAATRIDSWAQRVKSYACDGALQHLPYWSTLNLDGWRPLPSEAPGKALAPYEPQIDALAYAQHSLSKEATQRLRSLQRQGLIEPTHLAMAALFSAFQRWSGSQVLCLATIHHGRIIKAIPDVDLIRNLGWLVNYSPLFIVGSPGLMGAQLVRSVAAQEAALNDGHLSYTCLRYMNPDPEVRQSMARLPEYHLGFNFVPFGGGQSDVLPWPKAAESSGHNERGYAGDIKPFVNLWMEDDRLHIKMGYSPCLYHHETVDAFLKDVAVTMQALIEEECW